MILDTPLDVKGPYRLAGTVDVYFQNGKWIARSWPKRSHQPNSPGQLAVRSYFCEMLAWRKSLTSNELRRWEDLTLPPDKTWDDLWRSSCLKGLRSPAYDWWVSPGVKDPVWFCALNRLFAGPEQKYYLWLGQPGHILGITGASRWMWFYNATGGGPIQWIVNGLLCSAGKKVVPHYFPSPPKAAIKITGAAKISVNGQECWGWLSEPTPIIQPIVFCWWDHYKPLTYDLDSYILNIPPHVWTTPDYVIDVPF